MVTNDFTKVIEKAFQKKGFYKNYFPSILSLSSCNFSFASPKVFLDSNFSFLFFLLATLMFSASTSLNTDVC